MEKHKWHRVTGNEPISQFLKESTVLVCFDGKVEQFDPSYYLTNEAYFGIMSEWDSPAWFMLVDLPQEDSDG